MRYQQHYVSAFVRIPQILEQLKTLAPAQEAQISGGQPLFYTSSAEGKKAVALRRQAPACEYIGIDLHSDNVYVAIGRYLTDPHTGQRQLQVDRPFRVSITDGGMELVRVLASHCAGKPHVATVESTFNWGFLADLFAQRGWTLLLCDPSTVSRNPIKASNDATDAAYLCRQLATEQLKVYLPLPTDIRAMRDLVRHRSWLVQQRSSAQIHLINMLYNQLSLRVDRRDIKELAEKVQQQGWSILSGLLPQEANCLKAAQYLQLYAQFERMIAQAEEEIKKLFALIPYAPKLEKIAGIGLVLATTMGAEIWDIGRFGNADHFVSYARLAATSKLSNGKSKGQGNAKNGNAYMSWALTEAANLMIRCNPYAQGFFDHRLKKYKGLRVKAIRVMAAKLARGIYVYLTHNDDFDCRKCFHSKAVQPHPRHKQADQAMQAA